MIYDGKKFRDFSIKWYDYVLDCIVPYHSVFCSGGNILLKLATPGFLGAWQRQIWFSKLHRYTAWSTPEILQLAKEKGWEVYEMSPQERVALELVKKNSPLKNTLLSEKTGLWEKALKLIFISLIVGGLILYKERIPKFLRYLLIIIALLILLTIIKS